MTKELWPLKEAKRLAARNERLGKTTATFMCGFGASGEPHIGTVAEIVRTQMVQKAYEELTGQKTQLIVFVDDFDGLRRIPKNMQGLISEEQIGVPICNIFPLGYEKTFASCNTAILIEMLRDIGISPSQYTLTKSHDTYGPGFFNPFLTKIAQKTNEIVDIVTHDYGDDRKSTYCPFLPIIDGKYKFDLHNWQILKDMLSFEMPSGVDLLFTDGEKIQTSILDGQCKLQWKVDWPMRWIAFDVDYEMHGKDLIGSAQVGDRICKLMDHEPPLHMMVEMFVDADGKKVSKSLGNGLEFDEWFKYAPIGALKWYLLRNPRKQRRMIWDVIPLAVDSYLEALRDDNNSGMKNTVIWFIDTETRLVPSYNYQMILNLVAIINADHVSDVKQHLNLYSASGLDRNNLSDILISCALNYYKDKIAPNKTYRKPTHYEKEMLSVLGMEMDSIVNQFEVWRTDSHKFGENWNFDEELSKELRTAIYSIGKRYYGDSKENLKEWFKLLYQVLMGQDSGPQFHQFAMIFGPHKLAQNLITYRNERDD